VGKAGEGSREVRGRWEEDVRAAVRRWYGEWEGGGLEPGGAGDGRARNLKEEGKDVLWGYGGEVGFGYVLCRPLTTRLDTDGWMDTATLCAKCSVV